MEIVKKALQRYLDGLITLKEFNFLLDRKGIRGAIKDQGFIGYDYNRQEWITI